MTHTGITANENKQIRAALHSALLECQLVQKTDLTASEQQLLKELSLLNTDGRCKHFLPSLPKVVQKLFAELEKEDVSMPMVLSLIRQDPGISGNLIKMANSVYFNPAGAKISTINHAINMIGLSRLKNLVFSAMLEDQVLTETPFFRNFGVHLWAHCLQTAHLFRIISRKDYASIDYESHYLMGLLYDTGKLVLLNMINKILQDNTQLEQPGPWFLYLVFNSQAPKMTIRLAQKWNIPDNLIQAMQEQQKGTLQAMEQHESKILFKAKLTVSIHNLLKLQKISPEQASMLLKKEQISSKQFNAYFES